MKACEGPARLRTGGVQPRLRTRQGLRSPPDGSRLVAERTDAEEPDRAPSQSCSVALNQSNGLSHPISEIDGAANHNSVVTRDINDIVDSHNLGIDSVLDQRCRDP